MKPHKLTDGRSNRMWSGIVVLLIGIVFLLSNFGIHMPNWLFSWHTILLAIGLAVGYRRGYNGGGWLVMVLIGGYFTLLDITDINMSKYYFSFAFIALGLYLILKPRKAFRTKKQQKETLNFGMEWEYGQGTDTAADGAEANTGSVNEMDYIDAVNIFGGSNHKIISKNFKGGDAISIFGGCELNLINADFEDKVTIDIVAVFGGMKIVVPPTWAVKSEVTAIFGGIEDKRTVMPHAAEPEKVIILKGLALFGGMSITNF
ncbi:LiaF transmembrane domain-containing protein [Pedobacter sp. AW31-3R]|uniref:LiaF transmembrane domain-containing protein n=1 Tax=Pedobacter sp. AW31-3R TaxID=3445781 RepID=UPI003FA17307